MINFQSLILFLETRGQILATTPPGASPFPPFAPELGTAERGPEASSHEDEDNLDTLSLNRATQATTMAILGRPPSLTLPLATDIAVAVLLDRD
jgi:hypothetical protein